MSPIRGSDAQLIDPKVVGRILPEVSNYHKHGELYTKDDSLSVTVTTKTTYYVSTGWTAGLSTGAGYVVLDAANGIITIGDKGAGLYSIYANASFSSDKANIIAHGHIHVGGLLQPNMGFERKIGTANDVGNASTPRGLVVLAPGDVVDFRFTSDTDTTVFSIDHGGFSIIWIAGE